MAYNYAPNKEAYLAMINALKACGNALNQSATTVGTLAAQSDRLRTAKLTQQTMTDVVDMTTEIKELNERLDALAVQVAQSYEKLTEMD